MKNQKPLVRKESDPDCGNETNYKLRRTAMITPSRKTFGEKIEETNILEGSTVPNKGRKRRETQVDSFIYDLRVGTY